MTTKEWVTPKVELEYHTEYSAEEQCDRDNLIEAALRWNNLYKQTTDPAIELTPELWHAYTVAEKTLSIAIMPLAVRRAMSGDDDGGIP